MSKKLEEEIKKVIERLEEEILSASNWHGIALFGLVRAREIIKEETKL